MNIGELDINMHVHLAPNLSPYKHEIKSDIGQTLQKRIQILNKKSGNICHASYGNCVHTYI